MAGPIRPWSGKNSNSISVASPVATRAAIRRLMKGRSSSKISSASAIPAAGRMREQSRCGTHPCRHSRTGSPATQGRSEHLPCRSYQRAFTRFRFQPKCLKDGLPGGLKGRANKKAVPGLPPGTAFIFLLRSFQKLRNEHFLLIRDRYEPTFPFLISRYGP